MSDVVNMDRSGWLNSTEIVEDCARALVGDARYDSLPHRATYWERKSSSEQEWRDQQEIHEDIKLVLKRLITRHLITEQGIQILQREGLL